MMSKNAAKRISQIVIAKQTPAAATMVNRFAQVRSFSSIHDEFSLGDIKRIDSTPGNVPPSMEDTIEGRYSYVLFTTASMNEALYSVYEDMKYLSEIYKNCEEFRQFTENGGVGSKEIKLLNEALTETAMPSL